MMNLFRPALLVLVALLELAIIVSNWQSIWLFIQSNSEVKLLSTLVPILLSAPFAYLIWTWRDSDKRRALENEERKLKFEEKKLEQESAKWEHDIQRLEFETRAREVEQLEILNGDRERVLKEKVEEINREIERMEQEGVSVPTIDRSTFDIPAFLRRQAE